MGHPADRRLLTPGRKEQFDFESVRLMSRQLKSGSRVVALVKVIKASDREINYGTGKDVSEETIQDAREPLDIQWYGESYLELPLSR